MAEGFQLLVGGFKLNRSFSKRVFGRFQGRDISSFRNDVHDLTFRILDRNEAKVNRNYLAEDEELLLVVDRLPLFRLCKLFEYPRLDFRIESPPLSFQKVRFEKFLF